MLVLAERIDTAFDSRTRRTGLLGRDTLAPESVLAIAPSNAIHTFGMRFPIDVLFIDRRGQVVKRVLGLEPGRISVAWRAFAVLEFASPHRLVALTSVGDRLTLEHDWLPTAVDSRVDAHPAASAITPPRGDDTLRSNRALS
jgi:uncharacterized protein